MPNTKEIKIDGGKLPFSKVVQAGGMVYVSGVVGRNDTTNAIPFSAAEQAEATMKKIQNLLEQSGSCWDNAVKVTIFVTDMRYFAEINSVYKNYFSEGKMPARSCVAVDGLPDAEAKVEIEVIAEAL